MMASSTAPSSASSSRASPPSWDRLLSASQRNDPTLIRSLVSDDSSDPVSPDHSNAVGQSALHVAALWGHVESVRALLEAGADPNRANRITGASPLHCAVQSGKKPVSNRIECARALVEGGADANREDMYDMRPAEYLDEEYAEFAGVEEGEAQRFREVLLSGSGSDEGGLLDAIRRCDVEDAKERIAVAASEEKEGDAALERPDAATGFPPLLFAVDKILGLCEVDGERDESDGTDENASQRQRQCQRLVSIAEALLTAGADPNAGPRRRRRRPQSVNDDEAENEEDAGGDGAGGEDGSNAPLHRTCAALSNAYRSAGWKGRAEGDCNGEENGAAAAAEEAPHPIPALESLAALLVEHGAAAREPTVLLLHDAARRDNLNAVVFLVSAVGVNINSKGRQGMTALHFAARSGRADVARWLLGYEPADEGRSRVDVGAEDDRGKTALDAARVNDKEEVVRMLEEAAAKRTGAT